jgi:hemerythrin-like metal-binding protein
MDSARTIKALTECGAITSALKAEHYAIEDALQTLDAALLAGASAEKLTQIMDIVVDFCAAHFANEQEEFSKTGYAGAAAHTRAHDKILEKFRAARAAVSNGRIKGVLDATDLLNAFHDHVSRFDRAAHAQLAQTAPGAAGDEVQPLYGEAGI